jgi:hypothetical protein
MIKISLDEAYVFDILSIYEVKVSKFLGQKLETTLESMSKLIIEIKEQIGDDLYDQIIKSKVYAGLLEANRNVFDLVDDASKSDGLAKMVDQANYERYIFKSNLQNEFFSTNITEVKNK